jgi:hypothetical protein
LLGKAQPDTFSKSRVSQPEALCFSGISGSQTEELLTKLFAKHDISDREALLSSVIEASKDEDKNDRTYASYSVVLLTFLPGSLVL